MIKIRAIDVGFENLKLMKYLFSFIKNCLYCRFSFLTYIMYNSSTCICMIPYESITYLFFHFPKKNNTDVTLLSWDKCLAWFFSVKLHDHTSKVQKTYVSNTWLFCIGIPKYRTYTVKTTEFVFSTLTKSNIVLISTTHITISF